MVTDLKATIVRSAADYNGNAPQFIGCVRHQVQQLLLPFFGTQGQGFPSAKLGTVAVVSNITTARTSMSFFIGVPPFAVLAHSDRGRKRKRATIGFRKR